jgi:hypothetical protein
MRQGDHCTVQGSCLDLLAQVAAQSRDHGQFHCRQPAAERAQEFWKQWQDMILGDPKAYTARDMPAPSLSDKAVVGIDDLPRSGVTCRCLLAALMR